MNRLSNRPSPPDESELWFQLGSNEGDRKSTRLNSSHGYISYAVFCLKKKKKTDREARSQEVDGTRFSTNWRCRRRVRVIRCPNRLLSDYHTVNTRVTTRVMSEILTGC